MSVFSYLYRISGLCFIGECFLTDGEKVVSLYFSVPLSTRRDVLMMIVHKGVWFPPK